MLSFCCCRDVQKKKEANAEKIAKNKKDAEAAVSFIRTSWFFFPRQHVKTFESWCGHSFSTWFDARGTGGVNSFGGVPACFNDRNHDVSLLCTRREPGTVSLQLELMTETVERSIETEERKGGLVIRKALFGKLIKDNEDIRFTSDIAVIVTICFPYFAVLTRICFCSEADCINVTKPLQALVTNSEIRLVGKTEFVSMSVAAFLSRTRRLGARNFSWNVTWQAWTLRKGRWKTLHIQNTWR